MPKQQLKDQVSNLHNVIDTVDAADECTTADLRLIAEEINHSLNDPSAETPLDGFIHRLEAEAYKFADSHPALSEASRQVIDVLKNIGI